MSSPNLSRVSITLAALEARPVAASGGFFYCEAATNLALLSFDGGQENSIVAGFSFPTASPFYRLVLRNPGATANTIVFWTGEKDVRFSPVTLNVQNKNAPTVNVGSNVSTILNGANLVLAGNANGSTLRKQIVAQNFDSTHFLNILDVNGNICGAVAPGTIWTMESSDYFKFVNVSGAPILCNFMEVYYAS